MTTEPSCPVTFDVEYPEQFDRLSTAFQVFFFPLQGTQQLPRGYLPCAAWEEATSTILATRNEALVSSNTSLCLLPNGQVSAVQPGTSLGG